MKPFLFLLLVQNASAGIFPNFWPGTCIEDQLTQVVWHVDSARNEGAYLLTSVKGHGSVYPKGSSRAFLVGMIEKKGAYLNVSCPRK